MHRRQLLARVATTGLVLVGGARLFQARPTGRISEADIQIVLRAYDEASAVFKSGPPYIVGEHGPTLFSGYLQPMGPAPDYKWLAGTRWEVIPAEAPMSSWWQ